MRMVGIERHKDRQASQWVGLGSLKIISFMALRQALRQAKYSLPFLYVPWYKLQPSLSFIPIPDSHKPSTHFLARRALRRVGSAAVARPRGRLRLPAGRCLAVAGAGTGPSWADEAVWSPALFRNGLSGRSGEGAPGSSTAVRICTWDSWDGLLFFGSGPAWELLPGRMVALFRLSLAALGMGTPAFSTLGMTPCMWALRLSAIDL